MNDRNTEVSKTISSNKHVYSAIRRNDLASMFRKALLDSGLTTGDVAERLNVSSANVSRWLRGDQNLTLDTIYALADSMDEKLVFSLCRQPENDWIPLTDRLSVNGLRATITEDGCSITHAKDSGDLQSYSFLNAEYTSERVVTKAAKYATEI